MPHPTENRGWCKTTRGAAYGGGVSVKHFRTWYRKGLRYIRLENGRILTRFDWIDSYLKQFEEKSESSQIVDELTEGMQG